MTTAITSKSLEMTRRHSGERKALLVKQKTGRSDLRYLHILQKSDPFIYKSDHAYKAAMRLRQTQEILELAIFAFGERVLLEDKQFREINLL